MVKLEKLYREDDGETIVAEYKGTIEISMEVINVEVRVEDELLRRVDLLDGYEITIEYDSMGNGTVTNSNLLDIDPLPQEWLAAEIYAQLYHLT